MISKKILKIDSLKKFTSFDYINTVNFADEAVKSESLFRLISKSGDDTSPGERGLLLYKGGTVCSRYYFSDYSASAICREMGYKQAAHWTSRYLYDRDYQDRFDITLDNVKCYNEDWKYCSYSTNPNCHHSEDVFLTCTGTCSNIYANNLDNSNHLTVWVRTR